MVDHDEVINVAGAMTKEGGHFVNALGHALFQADHINQEKIKATWPEYWQQYKDIGEKKEEDI